MVGKTFRRKGRPKPAMTIRSSTHLVARQRPDTVRAASWVMALDGFVRGTVWLVSHQLSPALNHYVSPASK